MTAEPVLDLDIELHRGRFELAARMQSQTRHIAIVGPSGAGKTTLLRILAGLERADRGHVRFGASVWQDTEKGVCVPAWKRRIGWVPQRALLFPHRDVRANLLDGASHDAPEAIAERLDIAKLLDRRPRNLSGGERQRVALGRALLCSPELLLLDEPFSALDRSLRGDVTDTVLDYCDEHDLPLVLVSHDERDVARVADEVWELRQGQLEKV